MDKTGNSSKRIKAGEETEVADQEPLLKLKGNWVMKQVGML